jgi:hypothetical protein
MKSVIERFLPKIDINPQTGCWEWVASRDEHGYGRLQINGISKGAHRISYEWFNHCQIPKRLQIDHLCRNPSCVNPDHLEVVTRSVNQLRGVGPEVTRRRLLAITHCPRGHVYDSQNTYLNPKKGRVCRACMCIKSREYRLRRKLYV